jgi:hypothetical protein
MVFLIVFIITNIKSQTILERLDSQDYSVRLKALIEIRDNSLTEYIGDLVERTFIQPNLSLSYYFLDVLYILEYKDTSMIHQFINSCDQFPKENPLYYKVKASELLINMDDFTTVDFVFEYVDKDPVKNGQRFIPLLTEIAIKIPQHSQAIKDVLINIKSNSEFYSNRREALEDLILVFGEINLQTEILNSVINDPSSDVRKFAMTHYNFPDRKNILKQQIENDSESYRRKDYSNIFLENYNAPQDFKFILDYYKTEPDSVASKSIYFRTVSFIPPKPDTLDWNGLTIKLITYTDELLQYGWIVNQQTKDFYTNKLQEIITVTNQTNEQDSACTIINNQLLPQAEQDLQQELITTEGYKFLHYYTVYIKEEIEEDFGPCP